MLVFWCYESCMAHANLRTCCSPAFAKQSFFDILVTNPIKRIQIRP